MKEEQIPWRSWWDGGDTNGPIANQFNVSGWPTLYVIDHKGVIRHKFVGFPGPEKFDSAIDTLLDAAAKEAGDPKTDARNEAKAKGGGS